MSKSHNSLAKIRAVNAARLAAKKDPGNRCLQELLQEREAKLRQSDAQIKPKFDELVARAGAPQTSILTMPPDEPKPLLEPKLVPQAEPPPPEWPTMAQPEKVREFIEDVIADPFFVKENDRCKDTVRMLVASLFLGPNGDEIGKFLRFSRGFTRPRAKCLREQGVWIGPDNIRMQWLKEGYGFMALLMDTCVHEGTVTRIWLQGESDPKYRINEELAPHIR